MKGSPRWRPSLIKWTCIESINQQEQKQKRELKNYREIFKSTSKLEIKDKATLLRGAHCRLAFAQQRVGSSQQMLQLEITIAVVLKVFHIWIQEQIPAA